MPYKKILILDTGKEWGGGTNSLLELLKRRDKNKYRFTALFYNNYKKGNESDIETEIEKLGIDFLVLEQKRQPAISKMLKESARILFFFSARLKNHFLFLIDYNFRIKPNAARIAEVLDRLKINLIYMNNQPSSNLEGIMAARDMNIPSIQHSRIGVELNAFEADAVNNWLTKMVCVSQGVKDMFVSQGVDASKCSVVYNGIDPEMKPMTDASQIKKMWGIKEGEILIGAVGSLIKRKRINDLIEAMAELNNKFKIQDSKFKIMIVGDGPEKDSLQKQVLKMRLQDRVVFTGFQTDAISYINAMDIFVLPSEKEGLPRVILEAMLMAKPVVACDVTGPSELVVDGETGFLVPVKNPQMLADVLSKIIVSDGIRNQMGAKGRLKALKGFSIDSYVDGVNNIFEEVLG